MASATRWLVWVGLAWAAGVYAEVLFDESFDDNRHQWRFDDRWTLADGVLLGRGLAGEVLAVGCDGPLVEDFRATIVATVQVSPQAGGSEAFGLLYRFDPAHRNGCFVAVNPAGTFGFGRITEGAFSLASRGTMSALTGSRCTLIVEAVGDRHRLLVDGKEVGTWRDGERRRGGIGLVVIEAAQVAFESLRIETATAPRPVLGPLGPGPAAAPPSAGYVGIDDVLVAAEWRKHWNRMAAAVGQPLLPDVLDGADLAVLGFLKYRHISGVMPPAQPLAELLQDRVLVDAGAYGPGPAAAVEFWLQYAAAPADPDVVGGQEDLLAGLTWYQAVRARTAAEWGERGQYALVVSNELMLRLDADRRRFEAEVPEVAVRSARMTEIVRLGEQVRRLILRLAPSAGEEP